MNWNDIKKKHPNLFKIVIWVLSKFAKDNRVLYDFFDENEIFCYYYDDQLFIVEGRANERKKHCLMVYDDGRLGWYIEGSNDYKAIRFEMLIPNRKEAEKYLFEKAFEILKARK